MHALIRPKKTNMISFVTCAIFFTLGVNVLGVPTTTYNEEKQAQAVTVSFYELRLSTWNDQGLANKFKRVIAGAVSTYCSANATACGINGTTNFIPANVYINSDPVKDKAYLRVTFHVKYPDNTLLLSSAPTNFVLPKLIVEAITATARGKVKESLAYEIVKIGDVIYYKSPDDRLNLILIPIACCILLMVIIVAIVLHCWSKKKVREADKARMIEKKKKSPKVGPSPYDTPTKSKMGKNRHDRFHTDNDINTYNGDYKDPMAASKLPPLANQDSGSEAVEKDKKRHRRHKKSRKNKQNFENPSFSGENAAEVPVEEPVSSEGLIKSPPHNIIQEEKVTNRIGDSGSDNENVRRDVGDRFIDEI